MLDDQSLTQLVAGTSLFVGGQGVGVLMLILTSRQKKNTAKYLLIAYICLTCFQYITEYCGRSNVPIPEFLNWFGVTYILEGGVFYLYVKALVTPAFRLHWKHTIHLLPLLVFFIRPDSFDFIHNQNMLTAYVFIVYYLLLVGYCIAALRLLPDYKKLLRGNLSSLEDLSLDWLYYLIMVYLLSSLIFLVFRALELHAFLEEHNLQLVYVPNSIVSFILFYLIAMGGYRQQPLPVQEITVQQDGAAYPPIQEPKAQYANSLISQEASAAIWQLLNDYMLKEQPYLNEKLSLGQLAKALGLSPHDLSQVLNTNAQKSFYDFINGYRAEKAGELIESRLDIPMLDIGIEAGFANKATFYKHFKKRYSKTPLQYKKVCTNS